MAVGLQLTLAGAVLLSKAIQGKELHFSRGILGNAKINGEIITPTAEEMDNMTHLICPLLSAPIVGFEFKDNGDIGVTVRVKNDTVKNDFRLREIGLFATDPDTGDEILYAYFYDPVGDMVHHKNSYVILEFYLELITTIANAANVTCNVVVVDKIKPGIGLSRNVDTINVNCGEGISVDENNRLTAQKYSLPTASESVLGGVKIGENLFMNGDFLCALKYILPTGNDTLKGGFKVGENLYVTGDSLNSAAAYDDSALLRRLNQLEINLSNVFMKLNTDAALGITANLLLTEDFIAKKAIDLTTVQISTISEIGRNAAIYTKSDLEQQGYDMTLVIGTISKPVKSGKVSRENNDNYNMHLDGITRDDAHTYRKAKLYRTTVAITDDFVAYGPGTLFTHGGTFIDAWKGKTQSTEFNYTLDCSSGQEGNFELSGEADFTNAGYFTLT